MKTAINNQSTMNSKKYFAITKIIFLFAALCSFTGLAQVPTNGLIAWWPFNGNANDASGNGVNGTPNGITYGLDRFGYASSAAVFDGSTSKINCGAFHPPINSFSFSLWFEKSSFPTTYAVLFSDAGYYQGTRIYLSNDSLYFEIQQGSAANGPPGRIRSVAMSVSSFVPNQWYHIVGTSNAGLLSMYCNSVLTNSQNGYLADNGNAATFGIGYESYQNIGYFNGLIDDIRVYNRVLSSLEIQSLYHEGGWTPPVAPQNLVATAGNGMAILKWNKNFEADFLKYRIYKGTTSGGETLVDSSTASITDTTKILSGLTNGTAYFFKVTAIDSSRLESGYSNEVSATPVVPFGITSFTPTRNALNVLRNTPLAVTFTKDVNTSTLTNSTIKINGSFSGPHIATFSYNSSTLSETITPTTPFKVGEVVTVTLTRKIKSAAGDSLATAFNWSFTVKTLSISGSFTQTFTANTGSSPLSGTRGDWNGDGALDLAVTNNGSNTISILLNNGNGVFTQNSTATVGNNPTAVTTGDWNGDGVLDLAVLGNNMLGTVSILLNNGTGIFTQSSTVNLGNDPYSITAGDWNGDGALDLAVANNGSDNVAILLNNGSGTFTQSSTVNVGSFPYSVTTGDWNGDGALDLAVTNSGSSTVSILLNNGNGTFTQSSTVTVGNNPTSIATGDWNGDGALDLAVTNNGSNTVSILLNNGNGTFTQSSTVNVGTGNYPFSITSGDWNGDGVLDLAVTNSGNSASTLVSILLNNGNGAFTQISEVNAGSQLAIIAAGDWNGDGALDLAATNLSSNAISILFNSVPAAPQNLAATAGNGQVTLKWNKNTEADFLKYRIYRGTTSGGETLVDSSSASITDTTKTMSGLTVGVAYYFRVTAIDSARLESAYSNEVSATPLGPPTISSFSPISGPLGTTVTITGTNFNSTAANNTVYFGAVKATVIAATSTSLTVTVPVGASYAPISVTNASTGLIGYSLAPFDVTFPTTGVVGINSFSSKVDFQTGTFPKGVAIVDIDGDGKPDIVVTNGGYAPSGSGSNTLSVLRNTSSSGSISSGSFAAKVDLATGTGPWDVAVGDIDGDGKPDIVVTNEQTTTVSVFRNTSTVGSISFAPRLDLTTGPAPAAVKIADVDGDGKPDILVTCTGTTGWVSVYRNTSSGSNISFAANVDFATGVNPQAIAFADIDGDGKPDMVISCGGNTNNVGVFRNTSTSGNISFNARVDFSPDSGPFMMVVADVDGDGKPDIVALNSYSNMISVFRNTSTNGSITTSSFASKVDFPTGSYPYGIAVADLDGDGKPDIVVVNASSNSLSVFHNTSTIGSITSGSFASKIDFATGNFPAEMAIGDLDGDGKPELVVANDTSNTVSVFRNMLGVGNTAPAAPLNLTATSGNGQVTLKWSKNTEADFLKYRIYKGTTSGGETLVDSSTASITDTTKTLSGLTAGTTYFFKVTAIDSSRLESVYSNEVSAIPYALTTISSFSPISGPVATTVTITGTNFNTTTANDIVYFGAVKAAVTSATSTSLTVSVPTGATYAPITVTNTATGLSAYSNMPFIVTFPSHRVIDANSFAAKMDFAAGVAPPGVAIGDIDGDGKPDLVVTNNSSSTVSVYRNTSTSGTITSSSFASKVDFTTGTNPWGIALADLDGDGKLDLVVVNGGGGTVSIFRNTSTSGSITSSSFGSRIDFAVSFPQLVAIGDLDGDGKPDIAVSNWSGGVSVLRNTSSPGSLTSSSFAPAVNFVTGAYSRGIAIGDIDGDGKLDLVLANGGNGSTPGSNTVSVLRNTCVPGSITSSSFASSVDFATGNYPVDVKLGDVDGDGKLDVVVTNQNSSTISVLRNTSTSGSITSGSFAAKVDFLTGSNPNGIAMSDLDGDGKADVVVTNNGANTVSVLRNTSTSGSITSSSFAAKADFSTGSAPFLVAIGDLDGDSYPDVAAINYSDNTVSILRNILSTENIAPAAPQNLAATAGNGQVTLKWNKNTEADFLKYRIYKGTTSGGEALVDSSSASITDTTKIATGLTNGLTYYFRITAIDSARLESGYSTEVNATPGMLNAQREYNPDTSTVLLLHMDEASGSTASDASGKGNNGTATGTSIVTGRFGNGRSLNGTSDYILEPSGVWFAGNFTVEAWVYERGYNNNSRLIDFGNAPNSDNVYVALSSGTSGQVYFQVYQGSSGGQSVQSPASLPLNQWNHVACVLNGTTGTIYINGVAVATGPMSVPNSLTRTINYIGRSNWSADSYANAIFDEIRISNKARSPQEFNLQLPPTNLTAALTSSTAANLTWQNGGGMAPLMRYRIYRGSSPTNVSRIDSTTQLSYANTGLASATTYYYRVSAVDSTGFEGAMSNAVAIRTAVPSPVTLLLPVNATFQPPSLSLVWNSSIGASSYRVQIGTDSNFVSNIFFQDSTLTDTSKIIKSLAYHSTYYWRVNAKNFDGSSVYSSVRNFTTDSLVSGHSILLDGTSGYVSVPDAPSLDFSGSTITLEAWVKRQVGGSGGPRIIDKAWYYLNFDGTGATQKVIFGLGYQGTITSNQYLRAGVWYHIAGVYDGSKMKLYINGVLDNTVAASGTMGTSTSLLTIGRSASSSSSFLNGQLDEVRVWSVARDSNQIPYGMVHTMAGNETGLAGYWRMDEQSGTTTYDASVNGNIGTLTGGVAFVASGAFPPPPRNVAAQPGNRKVTLSWQPTIASTATQYRVYRSTASVARQLVTTVNVGTNGYTDSPPTNDTTYFYQATTVDSSSSEGDYSPAVAVTPHVNLAGNAVSLDGTSGYVNVPDDLSLRISGSAMTLEAWVKRQVGGSGSPRIIDKAWYYLNFDGTGATQKVIFYLNNQGGITSNQYLRAGVWYHIAGVYDGSKMKLYINGVLDNSVAASGTIGTGTYALTMGRYTAGVSNFLQGQLDEVRVWSVARDSNQIPYGMVHTMAGNETGLVGYWRMDESSGTTTYDATPNANNGTLTGSASFVVSGAFPPPPRNVAAQPGNGKVMLSWQPTIATTAKQYRVYRSTASVARQLVTTVNVGTNGYTDSPPANDTTYFYQVTTVDSSSSEGDYSPRVTVTPHANLAGNAVVLDGTSGYVNVPDDISLDFGGSAITLEAWVKRQIGGSGSPKIIDKNYYTLYFDGTGATQKVILALGGLSTNSTITSNQYLRAGVWYHIAGVYNGSQMKLYINGVLDNTVAASGNIYTSTDALIMGREYYNGSNFLNGQVDEVRVWSVARDSNQIPYGMVHTMAGNETGLVGYWRMDESSGTTTYDATPNGNIGTLTGSASFVVSGAFPPSPRNVAAQPGNGKVMLSWQPTIATTAKQYRVYRSTASVARQLVTTVNVGTNGYTDSPPVNDTTYFYQVTTVDSSSSEGDYSPAVVVTPHANLAGNAMVLDGTSGYVNVPDDISLDFSGSAITLEAWVKRQVGGSGSPRIIDKAYYTLNFDGTGTTQKVIFSLSGPSTGSITSNQYIRAGVWYHIAGVYNGSQMKLYINGVLDNTVAASGNIGTYIYPLTIGRYTNSLSNFLNGQLDEVRVWSVARDSNQIPYGMVHTLAGNETGLAGYWRMDEGSGTTTYDASVYRNNGTLTGGTSFTRSGVTPYRATNLAASSAQQKINLTWTGSASPNTSRYKIYRRFYSNNSFSIRDSTLSTVTTYTDSVNLTPGYTYFYTVTAVDSNYFESDTSNNVSAAIAGGTTIQNNISANTTWLKSSSPYKVISNIAVASGATLTIQPGVTVQLDLGVTMTFNGVLKAIGTSVDSIRFTTLQSAPAPSQWQYLLFTNASLPVSELRYCVVEFGGSSNNPAISSSGSGIQLEISNSLIWQNYIGINLPGTSTDTISFTRVSQNTSNGITTSGSVVIYGDTVVQNGGYGINSNGLVSSCKVWANGNYGVYSSGSVIACNVANNSSYGIYGSGTIRKNIVTGNGSVGLYLVGTTLADSNSIYSNSGGGINGTNTSNVTLRRNAIYRNTGNSGIYNISSSSTVENNTVVSNAAGITSITSNSNVLVRNNIVAFNSGVGFNTTVSPAPTTKFNDAYLNATNYSGYSSTYGNLTSTNRRGDPSDAISNISLSPSFVDTSSQNYYLQATSHMIDAGDTLSALDPDGSVADVGDYYFPQSIPPVTPTLLSPSNGASYQLVSTTANWNVSLGTTAYRVQVATDSTFSTGMMLDDSTVTTTSRVVTGLLNSTKYFWRVKAKNSYGSSSYTTVWSFSTVPAPLTGEYVGDGNTKLLFHADESSGSVLNDASGNGNTGTPTGTTIVGGRFGNARSLNGTSDFIQVPGGVWFNGNLTIEAWVYERSYNNWSPLIDFGNGSSSDNVVVSLSNGTSGQVNFQIYQGSSAGASVISPTSLPLNQWNHIACVLNGTTGTIYINGLAVASGTVSAPNNVTRTNDYIGRSNWSGYPYANAIFDEVRISNKARSPQEFNLQLPPVSFSATVNGQAVSLSWQNGGGTVPLLRYRIYRGTDSVNVSLVDSTTLTNKSNTPPTSGTYYYRISTVDSTGFEGAKNYASRVTLHVTPNPPQNFTAAGTGLNGQVQLKWNRNTESDFLRYRIYRGTTSNSEMLVDSSSASITDTTHLITGLTNWTKYYFRITAIDSVGLESGYSNEVSAVPSGPPTISSFSPIYGSVGTRVTITGVNFDTTTNKNMVRFGAVKATAFAGTTTQLSVIVPAGAAYLPITVTDTATGLTGYSSQPFVVTFSSNQTIGTNSFAAKVDSATGSSPYGVAVCDVDGDGKPDFVVTNYNSNTVSVFRNISTSGSISFVSKVDFPTGSNPYGVAIGDVDGDGKPDLIVTNYGSNTVSVFRNTSTSGSITASSFASKVDFTTGSGPYFVAICDLDGDGKPDLAVVNWNSSTVSVLKNTSSPGSLTTSSFASKVDFTTGTNPWVVAIGDVDGDGKPDFVVTNHNSNTVSVLKNTSSLGSITASSFASKVDFTTGSNPSGVAIGDVDGDGKPDLVVVNEGSNTVSVLRNTSTSGSITASSFASKVDFTTGTNPYGVAISDVDGDGKPDFVVANDGSNTLSVLRNTSTSGSITTSSFASKVDFTTGAGPTFVAICDVDGDGKPDFVVTDNGNNTVSVLRNIVGGGTAPPQPVLVFPTSGSTGLTTNPALTWRIDSGAVSYRLQVSADSTFATTSFFDASGFSDTSKTISGLSNYTKYFWRVSATNAGGTSAWSAPWNFTTLVGPPSVSLTGIWSNRLTLGWVPVGGAGKYYIYKSSDSTHFLKIDSVTTNTYSVTSLSPNTTYWLVISSIDNLGRESVQSTALKVTTKLAPTTITAIPAKPVKMNVSWLSVSGAVAYSVFRSNNGTIFTRVDSTIILSHTDSSLSSAKTFWYFVRAIRSDGDLGDTSNVAQAMTYPSRPVLSIDTAISGWQVNLSWQADSGSISIYRIYRSTPDSMHFTLRDSTAKTTYSDTGLTALSNYWYAISAKNTIGLESDLGDTMRVKTLRPLPRIVFIQKNTSAGRADIQFQDSTVVNSGDSVRFVFLFSLNGGQKFDTARSMTVGKAMMTASSSDQVIWHTATDALNAQTDSAVFKVVPFSQNGTGTPSQTGIFVVDNVPPTFGGIASAMGDTNRARLTWNPGTDISLPLKYFVYKSTTSGGENYSIPDTSVADTTVVRSGLINFKKYFFVVRAQDSVGNMDSNKVELSVTPGQPKVASMVGPAAKLKGDATIVCGLTVFAGDSARVTCFYSLDSGKTYKSTVNVSGKLAGITTNTTDTLVWHTASDFSGESAIVKFKVTVVGFGANVDSSTTTTFTVDNKPPAFAGVKTASGDTNKVTLKWNHATDLTSPITYRFFRSQTSGTYTFLSPDSSGITDTMVVVRSLNNFQKYYFVVRAMDGVGNSDTNSVEVSGVPSVKAAISAITTPPVPQKGDVKIPYRLTSLATDSVQLTVEYSINAGTKWNTTQNIAGKLAGIQSANYQDTLIWHTASEGGATVSQSAIHSIKNSKNGMFSILPHAAGVVAILNPIESDSVEVRITPTGRGGTGINLATSLFAVDNKPPVFAGIRSATSDTMGTSAYLAWSPAADMSKPIMYYLFGSANSPTINYTQPIDSTRDTLIIETQLTTFAPYYFSVRAKDALGNLEQDTVTRFVAPTRLIKISSFAITPKTYRSDVPMSVMLNAASNDTASLSLFYSTDNGISWTAATTITGKVSGITRFDSALTLHWNPLADIPNYEGFAAQMKIAPKGRGGVGNSSTSATFAIDTKAPRFTGLASAVSNDTSINGSALLSWQAATDTSKPVTYFIYGSDSASLNYTPMDSISSATYVYKNLQFNSTYNFAVRARDAVGNMDSNKASLSYSKPPLGSFNGDRSIDAQDLTIFANAWRTNDIAVGDIGPASGTPPNLQPQHDGKIDFEDLLVFVRMWNWSFHNPQGGAIAKSSSNAQIVSNNKVTLAFPAETVLKPGQSGKFALSFSDDSILVATVGLEIQYNPSAIGVDSIILPNTNDLIAISDVDSLGGVLHVAIASVSVNSLQKSTRKIPLQLLLRAKKKLEEEKVTLVYDLYSQDARLIGHQESEQSFNWRPVVPEQFDLSQNYPNPFNPTTKIDYQLTKDIPVMINVYNILGQEVKTLVNQIQKAGYYTIQWDGTNNFGSTVSSGVYFLRLRTQAFVSTKKLLLLR